MAPPSRNPSPRRLARGSLEVTARCWPHSTTTAHLIFSAGHQTEAVDLYPDTVAGWASVLRGMGFTRARTGAVGPSVASCLVESGFVPVQELTLLSVNLPSGAPLTSRHHPAPQRVTRLSCARRRRFREVLHVDEQAFGADWSLDAATLREAMRATGRSSVWVNMDGQGSVTGFVVVGATGTTGYVQRLAVQPAHQGHGAGSALLDAAHRWLEQVGCRSAVVNTEPTNAPALALYRRFGYVPLSYGLQVLELDLAGAQ